MLLESFTLAIIDPIPACLSLGSGPSRLDRPACFSRSASAEGESTFDCAHDVVFQRFEATIVTGSPGHHM